MFKSTSTSLLVLGALAIIAGIIALAWPGVTVLALVILFAVYAFTDAGVQAMRAFSSPGAGPVFGHLLLALLDLAAGVTALVWPAPTALMLVIVVGLWAFVSGCTEFFAAFASGESAGTRALFTVGGLVSIALVLQRRVHDLWGIMGAWWSMSLRRSWTGCMSGSRGGFGVPSRG